jgi:hypothetical protein
MTKAEIVRDKWREVREVPSGLSPEYRVLFMGLLRAEWCPHCGHEQPEFHSCQCENDE